MFRLFNIFIGEQNEQDEQIVLYSSIHKNILETEYQFLSNSVYRARFYVYPIFLAHNLLKAKVEILSLIIWQGVFMNLQSLKI